MARIPLPHVLTLSLCAFALGGVACSNSHSPTEPSFSDLEASPKLSAPVADESAPAGEATTLDKRRGRGGDDAAGDDRGGRGRRGRGRGNRPDDPQAPRGGQEFEGAVVSVNGQALTLSGGFRVLVNGQTQWSARGDLFTLSQVAGSVAAGKPTRVEGRGTRQADGALLAQSIKAEVDD